MSKQEYRDLLDEKTNVDARCYLLKKQNKELKALLERWQKENKILQESLDGAQREIMELKAWLDVAKQEVERLYDIIEGEGG